MGQFTDGSYQVNPPTEVIECKEGSGDCGPGKALAEELCDIMNPMQAWPAMVGYGRMDVFWKTVDASGVSDAEAIASARKLCPERFAVDPVREWFRVKQDVSSDPMRPVKPDKDPLDVTGAPKTEQAPAAPVTQALPPGPKPDLIPVAAGAGVVALLVAIVGGAFGGK
jgi:hypothetical protein